MKSLLCLFLLSASLAGAQAPAPVAGSVNPTADQIIDRYVEAIGGREAWAALTSRVAKGTVEFSNASEPVPLDFYAKTPDRWLVVIHFPTGDFMEGNTGTNHWLGGAQGAAALSPEDAATMQPRVDFQRLIRLKELFPKRAVKGREKIAGRDAWVIEVSPKQGPSEKLYFDVENGLLVRNDWEFRSPGTVVQRQYHYEDYRTVGKVKLPFTERQPETDQAGFVFKATEWKLNEPVDDARFKRP